MKLIEFLELSGGFWIGFLGFVGMSHFFFRCSMVFCLIAPGRYRGVLVPLTAGETVIDFRVQGESIVGSPHPGSSRIHDVPLDVP